MKERSLAFAEKSLDDEQKQLQLKAVPAMDVMKAETEVATRQQDLTVSKTTLAIAGIADEGCADQATRPDTGRDAGNPYRGTRSLPAGDDTAGRAV